MGIVRGPGGSERSHFSPSHGVRGQPFYYKLIAFIIKLASATVELSPLRSWLLVISLWWVFCYRQPWGCPTCQLSLRDCNGCGLGSPGFTWPSADQRVLCALCLEILGGKNQDFKIILLFSWLFNSIYWCYKVRDSCLSDHGAVLNMSGVRYKDQDVREILAGFTDFTLQKWIV